jgi:two-component sensor histidine kinase
LQAERMSTIGNFAAMILHDMRNAMNVISGYVELLEAEPLSDRRSEMAEVVRKEISDLVELIAEMLAFSRGDVRMDFEAVPIGVLLEEAAIRLRRIFAGSEIEFALHSSASGTVQADRRRLIRAFHNVAHNARRALADRGRFWIEGRDLPAAVELKLCDDGPGIPESLRPHLFTPFLSHPLVTGSGLGLAIVRHIVEAHGGSVSAEPLEPHGTAIVIRLPAVCGDIETPGEIKSKNSADLLRPVGPQHGASAPRVSQECLQSPFDERSSRAGSDPAHPTARLLPAEARGKLDLGRSSEASRPWARRDHKGERSRSEPAPVCTHQRSFCG